MRNETTTTDTVTLTKPQRAALAKLANERDNMRTWSRDVTPGGWDEAIAVDGKVTLVATGINTHVLSSLKQLGLIDVTRFFLRGHATADIHVTSLGLASLLRDPQRIADALTVPTTHRCSMLSGSCANAATLVLRRNGGRTIYACADHTSQMSDCARMYGGTVRRIGGAL